MPYGRRPLALLASLVPILGRVRRRRGPPGRRERSTRTEAIVVTWLEEGGRVKNPVDPARVRRLSDAVRGRFRQG